MNNLFDKTGVMALGTRLRILSEKVTKESEKIFELYNVDIKPKWYPIVYTLLNDQSRTVTQIAEEIGYSHVSVISIIKEMSKVGMLEEKKDKVDKRKTNITLSKKGKKLVSGLDYQHIDATVAMQKMLNEMENNLWLAIEEFDELFEKKTTYERITDEKKVREAKNIEIVEFSEHYASFFKEINLEWIREYFTIEEEDRNSLDNPFENIIEKGGVILIALYNGIPVGACSLIKSNDKEYDFELSKMAIKKEYRGKGIGHVLINKIINRSKELDVKSIYIETNTILKEAILLYKKVGFKQIMNDKIKYKRSNYQLILTLEKD